MGELHRRQNVIVYLFSPRIMFMIDVLEYSAALRIEFVICLFYHLFKILAGLPDIFLFILCGPKREGILAPVAKRGVKGNCCQGLKTDPQKLRSASRPQGRIHSSILTCYRPRAPLRYCCVSSVGKIQEPASFGETQRHCYWTKAARSQCHRWQEVEGL